MYVIKRNGQRETYDSNKVAIRLRNLAGITPAIEISSDDVSLAVNKVDDGRVAGIHTTQLDEFLAQTLHVMSADHPAYDVLAARVAISSHHKMTCNSLLDAFNKLHRCVDSVGKPTPRVSDSLMEFVHKYERELQEAVDWGRDFSLDYFGFMTMYKGYLLACDAAPIERPGHLFMREAIQCYADYGVDMVIQAYNTFSRLEATHATPTLFNAGTPVPQMSSCFLVAMKDDSIGGIYGTLADCAHISKTAGGIGLHVHNIRADGTMIHGSNGTSNGLVPMLRVFNSSARYVDQGGGRRPGAIAIYVEPWHADIFEFLELRKNNGAEERRCRDLFFALWTSDLFMERVEANGMWSLFSEDTAPGLSDVYGNEFRALYEKYEHDQLYLRQVRAADLWKAICASQEETGLPYMCYKDAANEKSPQKNLGTIRSSNLCAEVYLYSDADETAVCNLATIALPSMVEDGVFNFERLGEVARMLTYGLNAVIDHNYYPIESARRSNMRHRPIGLGVQGLADVFCMMGMAWGSPEAIELDRAIFETMYYAALSASCELAEQAGPYESYAGSPASEGKLQFDMWGVEPSDRHDWPMLRTLISKHGLRNSTLMSPPPTASTSQILGNTEGIDGLTSNAYVRRTKAGDFFVFNRTMRKWMVENGLWGPDMKERLMASNGSVQDFDDVPADLKKQWRTVWEVQQRFVIDHAAARAPFIDQSMSLNIHMPAPSFQSISRMHFYGWRQGLKTGMYYLRRKPASQAQQVTVSVRTSQEAPLDGQACRLNDPGCVACSG